MKKDFAQMILLIIAGTVLQCLLKIISTNSVEGITLDDISVYLLLSAGALIVSMKVIRK